MLFYAKEQEDGELLDEMFGGIGSWLKRNWLGKDEDLLTDIKDKMKSEIKTQEDKDEALEDLDEIIDATPSSGKISWGDVASFLMTSGWIYLVIRIIHGQSKTSKDFRKNLMDLRSKIKAMKV